MGLLLRTGGTRERASVCGGTWTRHLPGDYQIKTNSLVSWSNQNRSASSRSGLSSGWKADVERREV